MCLTCYDLLFILLTVFMKFNHIAIVHLFSVLNGMLLYLSLSSHSLPSGHLGHCIILILQIILLCTLLDFSAGVHLLKFL